MTNIDPYTGLNYRSEIEAAIKAQGFLPIDTSATFVKIKGTSIYGGGALAEGPMSSSAASLVLDSNYQFVDPTATQSFTINEGKSPAHTPDP